MATVLIRFTVPSVRTAGYLNWLQMFVASCWGEFLLINYILVSVLELISALPESTILYQLDSVQYLAPVYILCFHYWP